MIQNDMRMVCNKRSGIAYQLVKKGCYLGRSLYDSHPRTAHCAVSDSVTVRLARNDRMRAYTRKAPRAISSAL